MYLERPHLLQNRDSGWSCCHDGFWCCLARSLERHLITCGLKVSRCGLLKWPRARDWNSASPCASPMQYLRLPYLHQKQKSMSGWDFSAARRTHGEPFARCVCRWAPGGSRCQSAGPSCGHELAGSCWWSEAAERKRGGKKKLEFKNLYGENP